MASVGRQTFVCTYGMRAVEGSVMPDALCRGADGEEQGEGELHMYADRSEIDQPRCEVRLTISDARGGVYQFQRDGQE